MQNEAILPEGKWSTRDVHDTKFNEDKLSIQFRTGRLGMIFTESPKTNKFPCTENIKLHRL